jgi:hypothetical protein
MHNSTKLVTYLINIEGNVWVHLTEKIPSRTSALVPMDLLNLCPYQTTVVQEFHEKVGEARLNFTKWYIHAAQDKPQLTRENFVFL